MRYAPRAILAGGLGFAVSFVVACGGGSGLLAGNQSIALSGQADQISSAVDSGNCAAALNASAALNRDVQTLPITVNPTLRSNLSQGASTIARLAGKDCRRRTAATASSPTSTSSSSTSTSKSTSTSTSTTTPTTTTSTTSTSTTATSPTDTGTTSTGTGGVGLGGGTTTDNGNGNGNGSGGAGPGNSTSSTSGGGGD
jgi:hypothetical protein